MYTSHIFTTKAKNLAKLLFDNQIVVYFALHQIFLKQIHTFKFFFFFFDKKDIEVNCHFIWKKKVQVNTLLFIQEDPQLAKISKIELNTTRFEEILSN